MSRAIMWREELSLPDGAQASTLLREATLENRLETLREIALTLLSKVESLRSAQPVRSDRRINLHDEVMRFEIDLIRSALERTGGNQARAARLLGVKTTTLNAKLKRYKTSFNCREVEVDHNNQNQEIAA